MKVSELKSGEEYLIRKTREVLTYVGRADEELFETNEFNPSSLVFKGMLLFEKDGGWELGNHTLHLLAIEILKANRRPFGPNQKYYFYSIREISKLSKAKRILSALRGRLK